MRTGTSSELFLIWYLKILVKKKEGNFLTSWQSVSSQ